MGVLPGKQVYADLATIQASGAQTETGTGTTTPELPGDINAVVFCLDVTAAQYDVDDTLDVFVQTKVGANYVDVCHFAQILGNGGAKRYYAKVIANGALTEFENAAALGAAASRNIIGSLWRCRWTIADAGSLGAPSFTFSVTAMPM